MTTISEYYNLNKSLLELDFVDVFTERNKDLPLFIDPRSLHMRKDIKWKEMYWTINDYFTKIIQLLKAGEEDEAKFLLSHSSECKEIKLWVGKWWYWKWIWKDVFVEKIIEALKSSKSVETGKLKDIEELCLVIDGIWFDRISDMLWNILKLHLIKYTEDQCKLLWIKTKTRYRTEIRNWEQWTELEKCELPFIKWSWYIIFVPRSIVRTWWLSMNADDFYEYIIEFEQARHLNAWSNLCRTLKDWTLKAPTKKDLRKLIWKWKEINEKYINKYNILDQYKNSLKKENQDYNIIKLFDKELDSDTEETKIVEWMIQTLQSIKPWKEDDTKYQNHMIWCLSYLFYPYLEDPIKEDQQNWWNKRIDITMCNSASEWFFASLYKRGIPCVRIYFECKNYSKDIWNEEYDQLYWRFNPHVSNVWFILCRKIEDKDRMWKKLKTYINKNGFMYVLTDDEIIQFLKWKLHKKYYLVEDFLGKKFKELIEN